MLLTRLMRTKSLSQLAREAENHGDQGLKRALDLRALIAIGVGSTVGAGIFAMTGTAAADYAGPAIIISLLISAFGCALAALCYAEFAAMIPISGSSYTYAYATMGEFLAWIVGWNMVLEYMVSASTVAVSFTDYLQHLLGGLGLHVPHFLASAPVTYDAGWQLTGSLLNFPAVAIVLLCTWIAVIGIRESATVNNLIVLLKVVVILLFVGFGLSYVQPENWQPFIPANTGEVGAYGWSGIMRAAAYMFFAYIGFEAVSTAAQEAVNPQRDMPRGILISLLICTALYIALALVLTGMVKYTDISHEAPIANALHVANGALAWLSWVIDIGALVGFSSVILVMMVAQPRIFYSMARDGLLPPVFAKVHPVHKTPHINTWLTGIVTAAIAGIFPLRLLGELVSIGTLLAFSFVCIGVVWLRKTHPELPRPFRTPLVPFVPLAGAGLCVAQMLSLPPDTWWRLAIWLAIGCAIYFGYSFKNSKLAA
ncbi:MAG: amino acid permease [Gammaproteobacteria bacterium]|nr:amino acid permease [Gammaproteobacteria bacterium]